MKIGFFDSGLGGLVLLKAVASHLPQYEYQFYGDTANLPYGDKTEGEIYELTRAGCKWLFEHDCALIIIACNTASAQTLRRLQNTFLLNNYPKQKILGVIIPTVEELIEKKSKKAILIATKGTVDSKKYDFEIKKLGSLINLKSICTPTLVPLIEKGMLDEATSEVINLIVTQTLDIYYDTLVLGCTHYALLKDNLRKKLSEKFDVISQDEIIPKKLLEYLSRHPEIESSLTVGEVRDVHLTQNRDDYDSVIVELLS